MWNIPDDVYRILQYFTGEIPPYKNDTRDKRRMFFDEMTKDESDLVIAWFSKNKILVLSDIIRGRGEFSVEWVLVVQKLQDNTRWILKNINEVLSHYGDGDVKISPRGFHKYWKCINSKKRW